MSRPFDCVMRDFALRRRSVTAQQRFSPPAKSITVVVFAIVARQRGEPCLERANSASASARAVDHIGSEQVEQLSPARRTAALC